MERDSVSKRKAWEIPLFVRKYPIIQDALLWGKKIADHGLTLSLGIQWQEFTPGRWRRHSEVYSATPLLWSLIPSFFLPILSLVNPIRLWTKAGGKFPPSPYPRDAGSVDLGGVQLNVFLKAPKVIIIQQALKPQFEKTMCQTEIACRAVDTIPQGNL